MTYAQKTGEHVLATSGGVMILPRSFLHTTPLDPALVSQVVVDTAFVQRWSACVLRTKSVSVLLIIIYLRTAENLSDLNLMILSQIFNIAALFPGEVLIGGDWNMEFDQLSQCSWISYLGLKLVAPKNVLHTCSSGQGRVIDYFLASPNLAPFIDIDVEYAVPWKPHAGLRLSFPARLRQFVAPTILLPKPLPLQLPKYAVQHAMRTPPGQGG